MTIEIADCLFLSRAMGAPVPAGKDPQKWTGAAMANGERRAAGIAHLGALLGQLPTGEDFERVPVETPKRVGVTKQTVYAANGWQVLGDAFPDGSGYTGLCPCESGKGVAICHGADLAE